MFYYKYCYKYDFCCFIDIFKFFKGFGNLNKDDSMDWLIY